MRLHKQYEGENNTLARGNKGFETRTKHLAAEGITNVFQRNTVKEKIKQTLFVKYGVYTAGALSTNYNKESGPHKLVLTALREQNYICESELSNSSKERFRAFNEYYDKFYSPIPDIIIESHKLIIEIYGNYWHANPEIYDDCDVIVKYGHNHKTAAEIRKEDESRVKQLQSFGYNVCILWESDVYTGVYKQKLKKYGITL